MAYDPEMGGDTGPLIVAMAGVLGGHVRAGTPILDRYEPVEWRPRPVVVIPMFADGSGRIGVVDLLHPLERKTPRCGKPDCRCMTEARGGGEG